MDQAIVWVFGNAYMRGPTGPGKQVGVSYGYNGFGIGSVNKTLWKDNLGLGFVVSSGQEVPQVQEDQVIAPADMIAIADSMPQPGFPQYFSFLLSINGTKNEGHQNSVNRLLWFDSQQSLISASDDRQIGHWKMI